MTEKVFIAGSGGQGIMVLGKALCVAAMLEHKYVTWLPAYGPEVRGGAAHCSVIVSDKEIGSPCIAQPDTVIAMNALSLERFKSRIKKNGLVIINSSLANLDIKESTAKILRFPFTDIASALGNVKVANIVILGCYLAQKKMISMNSAIKAIHELAPRGRQDLVEINLKALYTGKELA